jgi:hypothetical protein
MLMLSTSTLFYFLERIDPFWEGVLREPRVVAVHAVLDRLAFQSVAESRNLIVFYLRISLISPFSTCFALLLS